VTLTDSRPLPIPDAGLRVEAAGPDVAPGLASIYAWPSIGKHAEAPTPSLPLVDIGLATNVPAINLTNKGALILRGDADFSVKISNAAQAGAAFAVIYNYSTNVNPAQGGDVLTVMASTEFVPIPAVFIGNTDGEALKSLFSTNASAVARIRLNSAERTFQINGTLLCEQVGVRVQTDHSVRSNLRITLISPQGTRSVLQQYNTDPTPGPTDRTYWSTHHFFESSAGAWTVAVSDEFAGATGSVLSASLILRGTQIIDTDHDGLDDVWETTHFGSLTNGPKDDPDGDGFSNAREQVMGTNPDLNEFPFRANVTWWELAGYKRTRLTWPSTPKFNYTISSGTNLTSLSLITNVPGAFWETEWLGTFDASPGSQFFRVDSTLAP
jgi:subtilisin-like proprotein convertase family protein